MTRVDIGFAEPPGSTGGVVIIERQEGHTFATLQVVRGPEHPWIDQSHAPVYVWRFPSSATDEDVVACCDARERWAKQAKHQCAWVVDLRELLRVPPHQRKLFADHLKRFESHDVRYNCGSAIVLSNAWLRGIVTAVFALTQPKFPNRTFASIDDGLKWASEQITTRRASMRPPGP